MMIICIILLLFLLCLSLLLVLFVSDDDDDDGGDDDDDDPASIDMRSVGTIWLSLGFVRTVMIFFPCQWGYGKTHTHTHTLVRCDDLVWAQGFCARRMAMFFLQVFVTEYRTFDIWKETWAWIAWLFPNCSGGLSSSLKQVHTNAPSHKKREQWNMWSVSQIRGSWEMC